MAYLASIGVSAPHLLALHRDNGTVLAPHAPGGTVLSLVQLPH